MVKREHNKEVSKFRVDTDRQQSTQQHYHRPEENGSDTTKGEAEHNAKGGSTQ